MPGQAWVWVLQVVAHYDPTGTPGLAGGGVLCARAGCTSPPLFTPQQLFLWKLVSGPKWVRWVCIHITRLIVSLFSYNMFLSVAFLAQVEASHI